MIKYASLSKVGDDDKLLPQTQVEYFGQVRDTMVVWPYGMGGNAPIDSYCLVFSVGANEGSRACIAMAPQLRRREFKEGEVYFGNLVTGTVLEFLEDGQLFGNVEGDVNLTVKGNVNIVATGDVTITAPKITLDGDVTITGSLLAESAVDLGGSGGQAIARVGDTTSDGATIVSGSGVANSN